MKNFDLNAGGILGALLCAGIMVAFVFSGDAETPRMGKLIILGAVGGGLGGNFIWTKFFGENNSNEQLPPEE